MKRNVSQSVIEKLITVVKRNGSGLDETREPLLERLRELLSIPTRHASV